MESITNFFYDYSFGIVFVAIFIAGYFLWIKRDQVGGLFRSGHMIDFYSKDLVALAKQGLLDPVIGREKEVNKVIQILSRRTKNNPVLVGKAGVGKTAIAEGLAERIAKGTVPDMLKEKRLLALDLSGLVSGTKYRGEFEQRLKAIETEIVASNRLIILFIDEIHMLTTAGEAEGGIGAADILKPALSRGDLQVVGATTFEEFEKMKRDATMFRRFQPVIVQEPGVTEALEILRGLKGTYADHHGVEIVDDALFAAVNLSMKYLPQRHLPDKAIDLLDEAASKVKLDAVVKGLQTKPTVMPQDIEVVAKEWFEVIVG